MAFTIALHRAIEERFATADEPIRLRIGVDTGEVLAEEKGYFGTTVIRASRIEGLAPPGGTLVSDATKVVAEPSLASAPDAIAFRPAGSFELKGLTGTHALFEVVEGAAGFGEPRLAAPSSA